MMQHPQYPCNRFGFGLNQVGLNQVGLNQVNYPMTHQQNYQNATYPTSSPMTVQQQHKPMTNWPVHHHQYGAPSINNNMVSAHQEHSPLTPPAEREATAPSPASSSYYMPSTNYYSPVDKSMTPPQELNHHHQMASNQESGTWWTPNQSTDYYHHHHHHQMLHHNQVATAAPSTPAVVPVTSSPSSSVPNQEPSDFQQRVAAALLKTHATLASRRCRRCRCPNCQVMQSN